jgi:hypothetical protein
VLAQQSEKLNKLLDQIRTTRQRTDLTAQQQLDQLASLPAAANLSNAARANLLLLDRAGFEAIVQRAQSGLSEILSAVVRQAGAPAVSSRRRMRQRALPVQPASERPRS